MITMDTILKYFQKKICVNHKDKNKKNDKIAFAQYNNE